MNRFWMVACLILGVVVGHGFSSNNSRNCVSSPSSYPISLSQQNALGLRPATMPTDTPAFRSGKNGVWEKVVIDEDSIVLIDKQGRVRYMSGSGDRFETERDIRYVGPGKWIGFPEIRQNEHPPEPPL